MSKILSIPDFGDIEYKDDLSFGEISQILEAAVDITDIQKPKVNANLYQFAVLQRAIIKAPFDHNNTEALKAVPSKIMSKIISGVMKEFPLMAYMDNWIISMTGMTLADLEIMSTSNVPSILAGTNVQLTGNP